MGTKQRRWVQHGIRVPQAILQHLQLLFVAFQVRKMYYIRVGFDSIAVCHPKRLEVGKQKIVSTTTVLNE